MANLMYTNFMKRVYLMLEKNVTLKNLLNVNLVFIAIRKEFVFLVVIQLQLIVPILMKAGLMSMVIVPVLNVKVKI